MAPAGLPLSVRDLRVAGDDGRPILTVPRLDLDAGRMLVLRGPSGAGKSTLLFALAGLLAPSGRVVWGDTDIAAMSAARRTAFRARHMGLIFQDHMLFDELDAPGNAAITALFAPRAARPGIARRATRRLAALGLPDDPGRTVASFSGGERQRIAVARALSTDPGILLADEPTASLDRGAARRLTRDLSRLARDEGRTLVISTHDDTVMAAADHIVALSHGAPEPADA